MKIGLDISVLNDKQKTGIAVYTYNLIDNLLKIDRSNKFILFGIATLDTFEYLKSLPFKNYLNVEMKIYKMPSKLFRTAFLTWQKINWPSIEFFTGQVDIFLSFNWFMPPQTGGKSIGVVYDLTPILYHKLHQPKTTQLEKVRLERLSKADLIISISENTKKDFLKLWPDSKVEVIYPGVSEKFTLGKYDLKSEYFLSVSTLEPRKNLVNLINAYIKSNSSKKLVLVGGIGWKSQEILTLIEKNKDKIKHLGFVSDEELNSLYKYAFCFIYPSYYEGFGIPVLEALSCGIPVICANTSSLPEVGGDAVIYIDPNNLEEMTNAIIKIEKDISLRKELSKKGLMQAKKFSWEKSAKKLISLYQNL